jgi:hypothetical protein
MSISAPGNGYFSSAHDFPAMTDWPVSRLLEETAFEKLRVRNDFDRTHIDVVSSVFCSCFLLSLRNFYAQVNALSAWSFAPVSAHRDVRSSARRLRR